MSFVTGDREWWNYGRTSKEISRAPRAETTIRKALPGGLYAVCLTLSIKITVETGSSVVSTRLGV
jgi:hypothetical protein